jgi:hypothetical protein
MSEVKVCKTCGVPSHVGRGHVWQPNGTMVQRQDRAHRMILFDSDGINALFKNIEGLIGLPIEKIVIESKARATQDYISHLIRGTKGKLARFVGLERIIRRIVEQGRLLGYGDIKVTSFSWKEAFMTCEIKQPYSLALFCGDLKGALAAIRKLEGTVSYEETGPDAYLIKDVYLGESTELKDRLNARHVPPKDGDITYHRCPTCDAPLEVSGFSWDFDKGTITQKWSGIRYAIFGSAGMEAVLDELERELGEEIPATIVEAQRMHAASTMDSRMKDVGADTIRNWLAVQGLGNLVSFEEIDGGVAVRVENPAIPLLLVGTMSAMFEFMTGREADTEWNIAADGDLVVKARPAGD